MGRQAPQPNSRIGSADTAKFGQRMAAIVGPVPKCRRSETDPLADIASLPQHQEMTLRFLFDLLRPRRRTTEAEVREAMIRCGVAPDEIAWEVSEEGAFAFGRKSPDDERLTIEQSLCLHEWTRRERIKVRIIAWERQPD